MSFNKKTQSYNNWEPIISAEEVYQQAKSFAYLTLDQSENLFWVEVRPEESGRFVIVMKDKAGKTTDILPPPYSARSRVLEYGSFPYTVYNNIVYFVNFSDQRIYKIDIKSPQSPPIPLTVQKTREGFLPKYSELNVSPDGHWLLFSYELDIPNQETKNKIGMIDLTIHREQEAFELIQGADFYKQPLFSKDGKKIAWLEWNHPFMPWDSTYLYQADIHLNQVTNIQKIVGDQTSSILNFCFLENGDIIYQHDFKDQPESSPKNFYNLYRYSDGIISAITNDHKDYQSVSSDGINIFAIVLNHGQSELYILTPVKNEFIPQKNRHSFRQFFHTNSK